MTNFLHKLLNFYFLALVFAGTYFSKFNISGPLYLSDVVLVFIFTVALIGKINVKQDNFLFIIALGLIYLAFSFSFSSNPQSIIIRQYALFGYFTIAYMIFYVKKSKRPNYKLIIKIAKWSFIVNVIYIPFALFMDIEGYLYFTPLSVLGVIVYMAYLLTVMDSFFKTAPFLVTIFFCLYFFGHASAMLSGLTIVFFYVYFKINSTFNKSMFAIVGCVFFVFAFFISEQFSDANASWRLLFWKDGLNNLLFGKFGILGNGFGGKFVSDELNTRLIYLLDSSITQFGANKDKEIQDNIAFILPFHNSFLTMAFHIGLLPALMIFYPHYLALKEKTFTREELFLVLSLFGTTIWCSFNVILELPHSSVFYWLIYFNCYQILTRNKACSRRAIVRENLCIKSCS